MTDTPHQVLQFPPRLRAVPKSDCQGEAVHITKISPVKLIDALKRTKDGLDAGMTAREIREFQIIQCEKRIIAEAKRRIDFAGNTASTAIFLRALAADIEGGLEL